MGVYIDADYLQEVVGDQVLFEVIGARYPSSAEIVLDDPGPAADITRAIATAEGIADAKLGRRFSPIELAALDEAGQGEAVKSAVAWVALYELAPALLPMTEEMTKRNDRARSLLKDIGKGHCAAGRNDPAPPPQHAQIVDTVTCRGLNWLGNV